MPESEYYPKNLSKFWNRFSNRLDIFNENMKRFAKCDLTIASNVTL